MRQETTSAEKSLNKRSLGQEKEAAAAEYLISQGYTIERMNYSCRRGEIDIIARDGEYLVFCEVKYRKTPASGYPAEAVSAAKQRHICDSAIVYLSSRRLPEDTPVRFDVVSIMGEKIRVIKNAFEAYTGRF